MQNRIHVANVREKFVAQTLARRCPLRQPGHIHNLNRRRKNFLRRDIFLDDFQPLIGHARDPHIRLGRRLRIRGRLRPGGRQRIKDRRLADQRKPDNSNL